MTEFEKGLVQNYKSTLSRIEHVVAGVHGVLTRHEIDQRDNAETQLVRRGLSRFMSTESRSNYRYHHNSPYPLG